MASNEKVRIRIKGYEHSIVDAAAAKIVDAAKRGGARVAGPIPLPTGFILCTARPLVTRILSDTLTTSGEEHPHVFCKSPARFETGHTPSKFPRGKIAHATSDIIAMLFHDHTQHCSAQPPKIILPHITNNFKGNAKKIPLLIENFLMSPLRTICGFAQV